MVYEDRKMWDIDFVGVLALDGEVSTGRNSVIINRNNDLQFYIRIVSSPPENFPRQVKDVCGFAEALNNYGFYDDTTLSELARKNALRSFLSRYILFFQVELRRPNGTAEFHIARNIHIVKKSDSFRTDTILEPIPIFTEEATERNQELFEQQLYNRKYVGDNKNISNDDDDTPSIILWRDSQDDYFLYGSFNKHDYAAGGFRFLPINSHVRKIKLQEEYIMESYLHDHVLFMDSKHCEELQSILEEYGEVLGESEGVEQILKQSSNSVAATVEIESTTNAKSFEEHANVNKEMEFMDLFEYECRRMGLYYDEKDLYNFHTAMKTGGLVILAGMSGTGKSKLVQCYARALRLGGSQLLFIPVRPFWQDDADVIGYLDTLHNVYRPGDSGLMNVLTRANDYPGELHIVCFDEMNLARVEHYFSQFLSVLELEENRRYLKLYNEEYSSRIYNQNVFPPNVRIGSNVVFVGTVNLDESTYHFSDKVLDRANVITLNIKPYDDVLKMEEERMQELPILSKSRENPITYDVYSSFKKVEREISLSPFESKFLWTLHEEFQKCSRNLGIGWRIIRQISHFLNNLPANAPLTREEAFDLQVVQRVLTKVRGSEEQFSELLGHYNMDTKQVEHSIFLNLLSSMPESYKFEKTRRLITEKSKELRLYGHTV